MQRHVLFEFAVVTALAAAAAAASGAQLAIDWFSIDAGGATTITGGGFSMSVTVGQPDIGRLNGGGIEYVGGFRAVHLAALRSKVVGDLTCDGALDAEDIDPFFLALGNPAIYMAQYPGCNINRADVNEDKAVDAEDIDPFFACLGAGGCP